MPTNFTLCMGFALLMTFTAASASGASNDDLAVCQQTGDLDQSIAACSRAVDDKDETDQARAVMYLYRGTARMTKGDLDQAISDFDQTLRLDPRNVYAFVNRSIAYHRKGDQERAIGDYRKAADIDPAQFATMLSRNEELKAIPDPPLGKARRGWLGVQIQAVTGPIAESLDLGTVRGALVASTDGGGPARAADIRAGDVIVRFDGIDIKEVHDLPKLVASATIGKNVDLVVIRQGKETTRSVKLGFLENEKQALSEAGRETSATPAETAMQQAFGMAFAKLSHDTRQKYSITQSIVSGVVVTDINPSSLVANTIKAGDVIIEINQEPVKEPADITMKTASLKSAGKKGVLMFVSDAQGQMRFVPLPLQ